MKLQNIKKSVFYGLIFIACICESSISFAQNNFENQISVEKLQSYIHVLTSDSLGGRDLKSGGEQKAGNYIANFFNKQNLNKCGTDNYHQCFPLFENNYACKASLNNKGVNDFVFWGIDSTTEWHHLPVYLAGYHQKIPDSIENHAIIIFAMDIDDMIQSIVNLRKSQKNNTFLIFFGDDSYTYQYISKSYNSYVSKLFNHKTNVFHIAFRPMLDFDKDLKLFFFNDKSFKEVTGKPIRKAKKEARTAKMMKKMSENIVQEMTFKYRTQTEVKTQNSCNIIGMMEGTTKKDEFVVIGAHYDHLGKDQDGNIYYGADDNASGTAALMTVVAAFAEAEKNGIRPKRSIVWIAFGSEEAGLLGSEYYINHPLVPLEKTVALINMDMIGRGEKIIKKNDSMPSNERKDNENSFVYVENYGKNSDFLKKNAEFFEKELKFEIKNAPFTQKIMYRFASDHANFIKKDIPTIVFFTGTHDDYHTIQDTPDKLNYQNMENISKLVFRLSWKIAND